MQWKHSQGLTPPNAQKQKKRNDRLSKSNDSHYKFSRPTYSAFTEKALTEKWLNISNKMIFELSHFNNIQLMLYLGHTSLIKVKVNAFVKLPVKGSNLDY